MNYSNNDDDDDDDDDDDNDDDDDEDDVHNAIQEIDAVKGFQATNQSG